MNLSFSLKNFMDKFVQIYHIKKNQPFFKIVL